MINISELESLVGLSEKCGLVGEKRAYLETLCRDLLFRAKSIEYRYKRVMEKKASLEKEAQGQQQKKLKYKPAQEKVEWNKLERIIASSEGFRGVKSTLKIHKEVDSDELFYEFETLLGSISSFVDYSIKILRIFYPELNTSKKKIGASLAGKYPDSKAHALLTKHFEGWIQNILAYRDWITHVSSLNTHLQICSIFESGCASVSKTPISIDVKVVEPSYEVEILPIYIPIKPDYRHKISEALENHEINYEDDFYSLDDYLAKIASNLGKFSTAIIQTVETELIKKEGEKEVSKIKEKE